MRVFRLILSTVVLVAVAGGVAPAGPAAGAGAPAPVCATSPSSASNVDTDCPGGMPNTFETTLAVNPTNPRNLVGAAINALATPQGHHVDFTATVQPHVSFDAGSTWATYPVDFNSYTKVIDPSVAFEPSGTVYLAAAASGGSNNPDVVVSRSDDGGQTWSLPQRVVAGSGSGGSGSGNEHPQLATFGNGNVIVTWIRSFYGPQGTLVNAPLYDAVSHDGGHTWSGPTPISGSAPWCVGSQGGPSCDLTFGNAVAVSGAGIVVTFQDTYQDSPAGTTNLGRNVHLAVTVDPATGALSGGPFFIGQAYDGVNEHDFPIDARQIQTLHDSQINLDLDGNVAADPTDPTGRHLAAVWYDDRNAAHPVASDPYQAVTNSDIVVSQSSDGGQTWSLPIAISETNDQLMPWAAYDVTGRLHIGYLDRAYDPANHAYGYTLASETAPGNLKFTLSQLTTALSDPTQGALPGPFPTVNPSFPHPAPGIGDYTAVAVTPTAVVALWTDMRNARCTSNGCGSIEDAFFATVPLNH